MPLDYAARKKVKTKIVKLDHIIRAIYEPLYMDRILSIIYIYGSYITALNIKAILYLSL